MKVMCEKLEQLGNPMTAGELQAHIKNSYLKCDCYDPNTATAALNRIDAAEVLYLSTLADDAARAAANTEALKHKRWIDFFVKEVKALAPDGRNAKARINYVTQETIDRVQQDFGTLNDNQHELAGQFAAWTQEAKAKSSGLSTAQINKLINDRLAEFKLSFTNLQCAPVPAETPPPPAEVKLKYDWWCYKHGVNTNHGHKLDGSLHKKCTNPGPNYKQEATINNPMGGNTKRDDKAGKYWIGIPGRRGGRVSDT